MSGFELGVNVLGTQHVSRAFSRFAENVTDMSPALRDIGKDFRRTEFSQFYTEGRYGGDGWKPLNEKYAKWKERTHPGHPILVLSGEMRNAAIDDNSDVILPREATFRIKSRIAVFHQLGTSKMDARPLIQLTNADKKRWARIIHGWLVDKAKEEGLL